MHGGHSPHIHRGGFVAGIREHDRLEGGDRAVERE
jgi:hypothetical protein